MKKIILLAGLFLTTLAQAQIKVEGNGQEIPNNYVYTTHLLEPQSSAELDLRVTNTSNASINLKLRVKEMINTDGTNVQFCFGQQCFFDVTPGKTVPTNQGPSGMVLAPGASNDGEDHFWSKNAGVSTNAPVSYILEFVQYDDAGVQIGNPLFTFTYKYDAVAGTTDFAALKNMGIQISNTLIKNTLDITANQNVKLEIFTINGQAVKSAAIVNGSQSIDLSSLANGVYISRFTTAEKKTSQIKIVKN